MATGVNNLVIAHSEHYRFNFYSILVLAVLNIVNNSIFIPRFDINGAAIATFSSVFIYNALKFGFLQYKLKMNPFTKELFWVILLGLCTYLIVAFIPSWEGAKWLILVNIFIRSVLVTVLFIGGTLYFNFSQEVTDTFTSFVHRIIETAKKLRR